MSALISVLGFIVVLVAIVLTLPVLVFLLQVLAAIFLAKPSASIKLNGIKPQIAILIPAHNESLVIAQTIQSIMSQLGNQDLLLVVADNCNDDTAAIARNLGATVIERTNQHEHGKGYALDYGLQHLKANPPQIVLIIDADCMAENDAINKLTSACMTYQRPVQALYLMESQPNPSLKARIAEFAWLVKNKVRPLGFKALGLPCQLMGTGMAFLWEDIIKVNLASGHIVEDMKLGVDFSQMNKAPLFLPEALLTSVFPPTAEATDTQRTRWEHGHLGMILTEAPSLFFEAVKTKNSQMLGLALDLIVPPLAVLTLLNLSIFALSLALSIKLAWLISTILLLTLISAVLLAWGFFGRNIISFKQLCYAPIYALVKIPIYIKFFLNRQVEWVRSKRD
jgi:cellulose synthase/poly-beta-1,6-N-acetylglucosamine synthase-like glycosyltransferase